MLNRHYTANKPNMMKFKLLAKILVWPLLLMAVSGDDNLLRDSFETKLFSASIACSPSYQTTDDVKCDFHLTNIGDRSYSVLTWNTPLDESAPKGLAVTRDRKKLEYDGILLKREAPKRRAFSSLDPGKSVSSKIDLSTGYDTAKPGTYTVEVDTYLEVTYMKREISVLKQSSPTFHPLSLLFR